MDTAEVDEKATRERLLDALRQELLGPEEDDEVLGQPPGVRYLVGMLAPAGTAVDPTEDDSLGAGQDEDGDEDPSEGTPASVSLDPSSIGISCVVGDLEELEVEASWGEYKKGEDDQWHRTRMVKPLTIAIRPEDGSTPKAIGDGVTLEWTARKLGSTTVVSVFLQNCRQAPKDKRPPDDLWLYQAQLVLLRAGDAPFLPKSPPRDYPDPDPDIASADLIYRNRREFATGHGTAAEWTLTEDGSRAEKVWTEALPSKVVPVVEAVDSQGFPALRMDSLAAGDVEELKQLLDPLFAGYEKWIECKEATAADFTGADKAVAKDHTVLARRALERMRHGLRTLVEDATALEAFRFANAAMAEQRRRTVAVRRKRRNEEWLPEDPAWRPFQIGFILICLPGMVDPTTEDREVADLLWFPTGGGKTEAYLGLAAFTFAHRRLREGKGYDTSAGTAVLMRYTLRLLTIQQFSRALTLLCACEQMREADPDKWGEERFTIGLWVGRSATPNSFGDSKEAIERLRDDRYPFSGSPRQIMYCPWCGHDIGVEDYSLDEVRERTLVNCPDKACHFSRGHLGDGLPVLVVDEEIYRNPPSLLLATVDKFAQMPWSGRIQALFGRVDRKCPRHGYLTSADQNHAAKHRARNGQPGVEVEELGMPLAPPELIIQDELHLISGPLGTLVGIYESAVEGLCVDRWEGGAVKPKVIASTATIRRASRQIESLFDRQAAVFPPLGLDASDSYFAREAQQEGRPGRRYVGVFAPGKSIKTALVRVYAALLTRALAEYEADPSPATDAYMTLVGYFNSIRELGGTLRLIEDDVPARLRVLAKRSFGPTRFLDEKDELTSQKRSFEIPAVLERLERPFTEKRSGHYPLDILLASNMISVGVDIDRLGLMVVSGQPKTTAEYIQATSRVGRVHPGLVVEVYNWSRPRDTSHYERFRHYHETFYRHVEATSITPFSSRARDRALAGVFASYIRLDDPDMASESAAENFDPDSSSVQRILDELVGRSERVTQKPEVGTETEQQLKNLAAEWKHWASQELSYAGRASSNGSMKPVLLRRMEHQAGRGIWPVANSLREVEGEVDVVLRDVVEG